MMTGFVYKWVDTSNGMYYIGCHKGDVNDGYIGSGTYFLKAYNKRPEAFKRDVLYVGEHFAELEEFMLVELNASQDKESYNLTNACRGQYEYTSEIREKIGKAHRGKVTSEATKRKMSAAAKGKSKSKEHRKSVAESLKGLTGAKSRRGIPVYSEGLNKTWSTRRECAKELNISQSYIWSCLTGRNKNKKYRFKNL
tara:strand:- start:75 stop:662 length:588 start_codon:yes stop_codon:yes gene_type:complete